METLTRSQLSSYYRNKIAELYSVQAAQPGSPGGQRNILNGQVRSLKEELAVLQKASANVGEVVKVMGKRKALVKLNPEGKFAVDVDRSIDVAALELHRRATHLRCFGCCPPRSIPWFP
jgi:26S proteasome regulatory subunit T6